MQTDYCLFIDRKSGDATDFTDLPFGDRDQLRRVADAALQISYVTEVRMHRKDGEMQGGHPRWEFPPFYQRENPATSGSYSDEEQFKTDLRVALQDDALFDDLYRNKADWKAFLETL